MWGEGEKQASIQKDFYASITNLQGVTTGDKFHFLKKKKKVGVGNWIEISVPFYTPRQDGFYRNYFHSEFELEMITTKFV